MVMNDLLRTFAASTLLAVLLAPAVARGEGVPVDQGTLRMTIGGRPRGIEKFSYGRFTDSLVIQSEVYQTIATSEGPDTLRKQMRLIVDANDLGLKKYTSVQTLRGHTLTRSVVPRDSALSSYREFDGRGEGDFFALPPGRLFVMDGAMFTLFDHMCRSLVGQTFTSRPLNLFALGPRDSLFEGTVRDLGADTLRWGGRAVRARRLQFADGNMHYDVWADPSGRMLRLEQPDFGVRIERDAPAIKRRAPRPR